MMNYAIFNDLLSYDPSITLALKLFKNVYLSEPLQDPLLRATSKRVAT